jgi:multidrug efflux pump subunit AcrB
LPGVSDIDDTYQLGSEEYRVRIDEAKAQMFGVTNTQIALTLRAAFAGSEAASIKPEKADKQIPILVRLPEVYRNDPAVFSRLTVENDRGQLVSLEKVVSIEKMRVLRSVKHLDGKKIVSVSASVDKKKTSSVEVNAIIKREFVDVAKDHPGYGLVFRGEEKENQKSFASLTKAMGLSFLLIFIILAALFNSMVQPLIIMAPIPLALIGVTIAFLIHGKTFSFLSVMGCIGLQGVIVNTTIVLVDFINKNRAMMGLREAVLEAGRVRLRPILVTNLTSFAGLVTIAYGIGGADPMLKPMALAMCWGLLFATSLKLLFVPALYLMCDDVKHLLKRIVPLR